jgi:hypothetical protein
MILLFIYFDFPRPRSRTPSNFTEYSIQFVECGSTETVVFEERILRLNDGLLYCAWRRPESTKHVLRLLL